MAQDHIETLRKLLAEKRGVLLPGAANALSARIIADLGFEAVYLTGAGLTNMHLGLPDLAFMDLSQLVEHTMAIRDVVALPLIVDADTGFGNALNVGRTVSMLERAGASAIQLEDQVTPKRCGHFDGQEVIPPAEMVSKVARRVLEMVAQPCGGGLYFSFSESRRDFIPYFEIRLHKRTCVNGPAMESQGGLGGNEAG